MASVRKKSHNLSVVHLGAARDSTITVELHMSEETAERLASACGLRPDPGCKGTADDTEARLGTAVLGILNPILASSRVKERNASMDHEELMALIDQEVAAVRAGRT